MGPSQDHELVPAIRGRFDRTERRTRAVPVRAGGGPISQGTHATHTRIGHRGGQARAREPNRQTCGHALKAENPL